MKFSEAVSSCAHRCSRGRAKCVLCLQQLETPRQILGAQQRGAAAQQLQKELQATYYKPTAHAVVTR